MNRSSQIILSTLAIFFLGSGLISAQSFGPTAATIENFTTTQGWQVATHFRTLADIDGDGTVDIVGFGDSKVLVAFSDGRGKFRAPVGLSTEFTKAKGWLTSKHFRSVGDVNGDGRADIVGFKDDGVYVQLFNPGTKKFGPLIPTVKNLATQQGWNVDNHPRFIGDVNGDGKADLIGFGGPAVFIALGQGNGKFDDLVRWTSEFTQGKGWSKQTPRMVTDLNGDGRTDLLGINKDGVYVAYSTGSKFGAKQLATREFANGSRWKTERDFRLAADVNNDGTGDLIGYGYDGIYVALGQPGGKLGPARKNAFKDFTADSGWSNKLHVRSAGDVNGDGAADLVTFGGSKVFVAMNKGGAPATSGSAGNPRPPVTSSGSTPAALDQFAADINQFLSVGTTGKNNLTVEVKNLTIRKLVSTLAKYEPSLQPLLNGVPAFIADDLQLTTCKASLSGGADKQAKINAQLKIGTTPIEFLMVVGRNAQKEKSAVLGVKLPRLSDMAALIGQPSLKSQLENIEKSFAFDIGFIVASAKAEEGLKSGMTGFEKFLVQPGLSIQGIATVKWDHIFRKESPEIRKRLKTIFSQSTAKIMGSFSGKGKATMGIDLDLGIGIPSPIAKYSHLKIAEVGKGSMTLALAPGTAKITTNGTITINLYDQNEVATKLDFTGGFVLDGKNAGVGLHAGFKGLNGKDATGWENPFGIPGISISSLAIGAQLEANIPWVSGGVGGNASLGLTQYDLQRLKVTDKSVDKVTGEITVLLDVNSPESCVLDLSFNKISIADLMRAFPIVDIPRGSQLEKGLESGLKNTKIYISPTAQTFADKNYPMGFSFKTQSSIFGWNGLIDLEMNPNPGSFRFKVKGTMNPLALAFGKGNSRVEVFNLKGLNGQDPKLDMEATADKFPTASGNVDFSFLKIGNNPALVKSSGELEFNSSRMFLEGDVNLFGLYRGNIELSATNYADMKQANFLASASFDSPADLNQRLADELVRNARAGMRDASALKANSSAAKPFDQAAKSLYLEMKKAESGLADAAAYILTEGLTVSHFSFNGNVNMASKAGSIKVHIKGRVGGKSFDEKLDVSANSFEIAKVMEATALKVAKAFEQEGKKLVESVDQAVGEGLNFFAGIVKPGFSQPYYKVKIDYKSWGLSHVGTAHPITVVLKDVNKREIGRASISSLSNTWSESSSYTYFDTEIKRTAQVAFVEVLANNKDRFFLDDISVELGSPNARSGNLAVGTIDLAKEFGYSMGAGGVVEAWKTKVFNPGSSVMSKEFALLPVKEDNITPSERNKYLFAFHYTKEGDRGIKVTMYDHQGKSFQPALDWVNDKGLGNWWEYAFTTDRIIGKIVITNTSGKAWAIDEAVLKQRNVKPLPDVNLRLYGQQGRAEAVTTNIEIVLQEAIK